MRQCPFCGTTEIRDADSLAPCSDCNAEPIGELREDEKGDWWEGDRLVMPSEIALGWKEGNQRLVDRDRLAYLGQEHRHQHAVAQRLRDLWSAASDQAERARCTLAEAQRIYDSIHPEEEIPF